jgi:transmembrane sensor
MTDFARRLSDARQHAAPRWTSLREQAIHERVQRAARRSALLRRYAYLGSAVAAAVTLFLYSNWARQPSAKVAVSDAPAPIAKQAAAPLLRLADGSMTTGLSADAEVEMIQAGARQVLVRLSSGMARFEVTPSSERKFRVEAGDALITVLGTIFVAGISDNGVLVRVEKGSVRVDSPALSRVLQAGESTVIQPSQQAVEDGGSADAAQLSPSEPTPKVTSWRVLAEDRDYKTAYARLLESGPKAVRDDPNDLLLAADVARLSGHPQRAVAYLRLVLNRHASDASAPLAAFTLGRVLLEEAGQPAQAAAAFARARSLAPEGPLVDNALAREVESWARAGDEQRARERGLQYLRLFPRGPHASFVRRHASLD